MGENNVDKTDGFATFPKILLLKPLVLQHVQHKQLLKQLTVDMFRINVARNAGFTTCSNKSEDESSKTGRSILVVERRYRGRIFFLFE